MYAHLPSLPPLALVTQSQSDLVLSVVAVVLAFGGGWIATRRPSGRQRFVMELYARCCGEEHTPKPHRMEKAA